MRKLFTLALLATIAVGVNAQKYRKWNFSNWSAATVANLKADAAASSTEGWSDIEKAANAGAGKVAPEATADKCFWLTDANGGAVKANGVAISELDGLNFNSGYTTKRSLAIAVDYPSTSIGTYNGPQYLWLGGGGKSLACFTIPKVKVGTPITMGVESHKSTDPRGVELYVGSIAAENKIGDSFKPTTFETYTWENWTSPNGETDEVDIIVYNTSGCHIYTLEVGDPNEKSKVAYLYAGEADGALEVVQTIENYEVAAIDVATSTPTAEELQVYDAVVIAANIPTDNAIVAVLKNAQPWVPMVNMNAAMFAAWGYGNAVETSFPLIGPKDANDKIFQDVTTQEIEGGLYVQMGNIPVVGVSLAGKFADDPILATATNMEPGVVTIHTHNITHNGYIYVPYTAADASAESKKLLENAIKMAANSKADITATPQPMVTLSYENMKTMASISCSISKAAIYYTIDGSEPTEASTLYTEPVEISTEGVTLKAIAIAEGYTASTATEQPIDLRKQLEAPEIAMDQSEGVTTVTLTTDQAGASIYYNYSGSEKVAESSLYTKPVAISIPGRTISAFAVAENFVNSELASQKVDISNAKVRIDVLSHMDANSEQYNQNTTHKGSADYYFSWANSKTTYPFWKEESKSSTIETDPETGDEKEVVTYSEMNPEEEEVFETGWAVRSRGQLVDLEGLSSGTQFGDNSSYNYATVDDQNPYFPATKNTIVLADKNTTPSDVVFPYNAYMISTQTFAGPFDVVVNLGSIVKAENEATHNVVIQTATDNKWESDWQTLGDTIVIQNKQRLTVNVTRSYEGADPVYVRVYLCGGNSKVGIYDIYVANAGEKSKEITTGIAEQKSISNTKVSTVFNINGMRQARLQRGVNIVRYSDGTTRKVFVK